MAILIPSRSTRLTQPSGRVEVDPGYGVTPIGLFLPASFTSDAATGDVFTRGSAATLITSRAGRALNQTAVNTGLHRTIPGLQSVSDYTAIWHGVPIGAPSGSTPAFVGIANSATSQGAGPLSIEYLSTTQLQVVFKSGTSGSSRAGSFTWANTYGKPTTLVASYSADEDFVRLRVCVDGVVTDVVASAVSSGAPPTVLGTERLIVGPDVVEIPTRHTNAHVALAGVFYGRLRGDVVQDVLRNPWRLFRPVERRIIVALSSGGGAVAGNASGALASLTIDPATGSATGGAQAQGALSAVTLSPAEAAATGGAVASAALASLSIDPATASASGGTSIAGDASASLASLSINPATASATGGAQSSASLASVNLSPAQASATGGAAASASLAAVSITPAQAVASGGESIPATASAALAGLSVSPMTATASGGAVAAGPMVGINLTPAEAQAAGGAWIAAELAALSVTPLQAVAIDGGAVMWPAKAVRAVVPATFGRLVVPAIDATATVPAAETRAIVPATGDDMQPIKTIEQYRQDRATYKIDFDAKFLASTGDTAQTLKAVGHDPGISVTSQVPVGGPLSSGVVHVAVDDPEATGDYKVWAQIRTVGGDERTGVIVVRVEDL